MSSNSKRKRVALVGGKVTKKKKITDEDDVVAEIIKSMDAEHQKFSKKKMEAYQSMLEQKRADKNPTKCDVTSDDVSNRHTKLPKKIFTEKKHPLMAKCQKNLKYLKHNRSIPKQRAHVGTLQLSPKDPTVKKQACKKLVEAPSTIKKAKNSSYTGNIWMVSELNKKLLESDSSDMEDITQEHMWSPVNEDNKKTSDNDSDFETFIQSHKEPIHDYDMGASNSTKKRKKKKINKSKNTGFNSSISNPAEPVSKKVKTISEAKNTFTAASPTGRNSRTVDKKKKKMRNSNSVLQSEESILQDFHGDMSERISSSSKLKHKNQGNETLQPILEKERSGLNISDCSVKLVRNPTLDSIVLHSDSQLTDISCEQDNLSIISSESNDPLVGSASHKGALEKEQDSDDDCVIIEIVPTVNNSGTAGKSQILSSNKPLLTAPTISTSDKFPIDDKHLKAPALSASPIPSESDIQILSVTSLLGSLDEHLDKITSNEVQNGKDLEGRNCKKTLDRKKTENNCDIESFSLSHEAGVHFNSPHTHNSFPVIHSYQLPEQPPQVNVDELLTNLDVESIKKVVKFPSQPLTDVSFNNLTSSTSDEGLISDISSKNKTINVLTKDVPIGSTPAQLQDFSDRTCVLPTNVFLENANESGVNSFATRNTFNSINKEELKNILSVSNSNNNELGHEQSKCHINTLPHQTLSAIYNETQLPDRFVLNENLSTSTVNARANDDFWNNIKKAISSDIVTNINTSPTLNTPSLPTHLSNNNLVQPNPSTVCGANYPIPSTDLPKIYDISQFSKPTVVHHQLNKTVNQGQNSVEQKYVASPSDELDVIAASSIQELCHQPEPCSILPLFKLYNRESNTLNTIRSAGQNVSEGLKILEKDQAKKVRLIERAIENYCIRDPCFYKAMEENKLIKSEVTPNNKDATFTVKEKLELDEATSQSSISSKPPKVLCQECGKTALIKCLGCSKVFYCSEKCGMTNWRKNHFQECKNFSS